MGCDIHMCAEIRKNDKWEHVKDCDPYDWRNYDFFAVLANVRNGSGFAGCDTGDGFVPISEPRGLPDDVSPETKEEVGDWGHSYSHLTLQEFLDYDWTRTTKKRGWVNVSEYKVFKEKGRPDCYSGGVSGGNVKHISNEQLDQLITLEVLDDGFDYYTQVEWEAEYQEWLEESINHLLGNIKPLGEPEDVRIVFCFDS